jgi:hypothetical protein
MSLSFYRIESESPSTHWKYFDVKNKNVLDLGCGRWGGVTDIDEITPFYFYNQGASKVIGVDANYVEINYLIENNISKDNITPYNIAIESEEQIKHLLHEGNIQAIKSDIEGQERLFYNFTKNDFTNITNLAIEYHGHDIQRELIRRSRDWDFKLRAIGELWVEGYGVLFFEK